jgi:hypothetical protein
LREFSRLFSYQGFTAEKGLRIVRAINDGNVEDTAQMVKLVDTPASGAGGRKAVEVRVFSWAPNSDQTRESGFFRFWGLKLGGEACSSAHEKVYRLSL